MHWLALPEPKSDTPPAFDSPEGAASWLAAQPQAQPMIMLPMLRQQVQAIDAATGLDPALAIGLLDQIRLASIPHQDNLSARYSRKALPMLPEDQRCFELAYKLWASFAIAYLRRAPDCPPALQGIALHRAANDLRMTQYCHFLAARECPEVLDRLCFVTLAQAASRELLLQPLSDPGFPQMGESNCAGHLAWTFLLKLINPYQLSAVQLVVANRAISRWREMASFLASPDPDSSAKLIDLVDRLGSPLPDGMPRWLNIRSVLRKIRQRVDALDTGESPEALKLGRELSAAACARLLRAMAEALRGKSTPTRMDDGSFDIHFGSEFAYALLTGQFLNDEGLDERGSSLAHQRVALFGFDRVSQVNTTVKKLNIPAETWQGIAGRATRQADVKGERRQAPCLVAAMMRGRPRLGIMDSLMVNVSGDLIADLNWFDDEIECGWIRNPPMMGARMPKQPIFLLQRTNLMSVVVPVAAGTRLDVPISLEGTSAQRIVPTEVMTRGIDFVRYVCHPA